MSLDFGLHDVHVLITGASGGIGLEAVHTFLKLGARVTAHYNSNIGELGQLSNDVVALQADVRDENSVNNLLSKAADRNGPVVDIGDTTIDAEICPRHIADMELSQWSNTIAVNLTGPFLLCKAYLRALRLAPDSVKNTANIVFISSTAAKFGEANHGDYSASKSALSGLSLTLKNEIVAIAPQGRVNIISPGWVATPMAAETLKDTAFVDRALATTPLQKVATPADVARQVAVLASSTLSGHLSGTNISVDGGMEGRLLFPSR